MIDLDLQAFLILAIGCSIAAFVDAAAGGGGIISLPAYFLAGVPAHFALGTNKFTASTGTVAASLNFFRHGKVCSKLMLIYVPITFIAAALGTKTVLLIEQSFLRPLIMVLTFIVGIYVLVSKKIGSENQFDVNNIKKSQYIIGGVFSFLFGFYDGFFGPGTGSFFILSFIFFFKMDFVLASGNAKVLNLTSNASSLLFFALDGKIYYVYSLLIPFVVVSAILGSRLALTKGIKFIKPIFIVMSLGVSIKLLYDIIFS